MCRIDVDQFYGIEPGEFPARIAEVALWMMDHIMNNRLSLEFGESYVRIPLKKSPHPRFLERLGLYRKRRGKKVARADGFQGRGGFDMAR